MICHCKPVWRGGDGCGPDCINRVLCIECVPVGASMQLAVSACMMLSPALPTAVHACAVAPDSQAQGTERTPTLLCHCRASARARTSALTRCSPRSSTPPLKWCVQPSLTHQRITCLALSKQYGTAECVPEHAHLLSHSIMHPRTHTQSHTQSRTHTHTHTHTHIRSAVRGPRALACLPWSPSRLDSSSLSMLGRCWRRRSTSGARTSMLRSDSTRSVHACMHSRASTVAHQCVCMWWRVTSGTRTSTRRSVSDSVHACNRAVAAAVTL